MCLLGGVPTYTLSAQTAGVTIDLDAEKTSAAPKTFEQATKGCEVTPHQAVVGGVKSYIWLTASNRYVFPRVSKRTGGWYLQYFSKDITSKLPSPEETRKLSKVNMNR